MPRKRKEKSEAQLARESEYNSDYYKTNRDKLLKKKAKRYKEDPEYRRGMLMRAKRSRWLEQRPDERENPPFGNMADLEPRGTIEITVDNPSDARHKKTVAVKVYSTAAVAELLGRIPEVLRVWWKRGQLPEPYHRGPMVPNNMVKGRNPRLFTEDEVKAIDKVKERLNLPSRGSVTELFARAVEEEFAQMHQGLYVREK